MVRAGVVKHPSLWPHGGYQEIQHPRKRYRIVKASGDKHVLREMPASYNAHFNTEKEGLSLNNGVLWEIG